MGNGEICRWAWEKSKGNRWTLWLAEIFALFPLVPGVVLIFVRQSKGLATPDWWLLPLSLVESILNFGVLLTAMELVYGREPETLTVFVPFRREWLKKAVLLALLVTAVGTAASLYPNSLVRRGQEMMAANDWANDWENIATLLPGYEKGQRLVQRGQLLDQVFSAPFHILFFPLGYLLFLRPEMGVGQIMRESASIVGHNLGRMIGLFLRSYFLLLGGVLLILFVIRGGFALLFLAVYVGFWAPWNLLAMAKLAVEMIEVGPEEPWWART